MKNYRKHLIAKSLGISLSILCFLTAIVQYCSKINMPETKMINAFSIKDTSKITKEILCPNGFTNQPQAINLVISSIKKYDKDVVIISNNNAGNYCDYYFYSPKLNKNCGVKPLFQGSNIHVAITGSPVHLYIGIPYIDYDF